MHHPGVEGHYSKYSKTVPHRVLAERLEGVVGQEEVETRAIQIFKLTTLLIPPANRRKLQLLLKFIRKVKRFSLKQYCGSSQFCTRSNSGCQDFCCMFYPFQS